MLLFFFSSRRRHTRYWRDWSSDVCSSDLKYAADLAAEAVRMGFSEIQLDYVRFPDEDRIIHEGEYAKMNGRVRAQVIRDQLAYVRSLVRPLRVPLTIDVFEIGRAHV